MRRTTAIARILDLCLLLLACTSAAAAEVSLHGLFVDNMVLQRGVKAPVWGTAGAGEEVAVAFGKQSVKAKAGDDGRWKAELEPLEPGGPFDLIVAGKNTITVKNVLVGDVWICSGQSNMQFTVSKLPNANGETAQADFPQIRHFRVVFQTALEPSDTIGGRWDVCSPQLASKFTAVGYFFGRELHQDLKIPIGLLNASVGGTPAEAWTSKEALESAPDLKPILDRAAGMAGADPKHKEAFGKALEKWKADAEKAKAEGKPEPQKPRASADPQRVSALYNGMIAPLVPFAFKGVLWYQGEANVDRAFQYRKIFPTLIQDWRKRWGAGDFPFLFVQLPNYKARNPDPAESSLAELREAQAQALALPKTGMAVTMDIGEEKDNHPKNKQDVGKRLALAAQHIAYGKDLVYSESMKS